MESAGFDVAGEFASLAAANAATIDADAIVIASGANTAVARRTAIASRDEISGRDYEVVRRPADARGEDDEAFDEPLTSREIQVLELLAEGLSNKAIAERLGISDQTVKFHVASISGKLGAANRTDAVRRAVRRGLITL